MAWDVPNPKGRVASALAIAIFLVFIIMIIVRRDFSLYPVLLLALFALLLVLSALRFYQEWKEGGDWLEPGKESQLEKKDMSLTEPAKKNQENKSQ